MPEFQHSPDVEVHDIPLPSWLAHPLPVEGEIALEAVTEVAAEDEELITTGDIPFRVSEAVLLAKAGPTLVSREPPPDPVRQIPSPPHEPLEYLALNPWSFSEYLHLLDLVVNNDHDWDCISSAMSAASAGRYRSPWDCWHRWTVPWCTNEEVPTKHKSNAPTYAHAPGVQRPYRFVEMRWLIDMYRAFSLFLSSEEHASVTPTLSSAPLIHAPRARRHHPAYPAPTSRPNVPARTYGHRDWGMSAWFHMSAVNVTTLKQLVSPAETDPPRMGLPRHLRELKIPPPPHPTIGHKDHSDKSDPAEVRVDLC
ncbi:hypothetical protein BV25DRAFT_151463 [Artomyces pyxidatus]|uniref:Uncharacterized protein n=1 Tax=Artomyces pyxidatus TaxID=48021 RepID=A0ACB8T8U5_9AGAM|nr:hypothetical protein BV25DRAFT_151463 [Artomyces pyxidatus]